MTTAAFQPIVTQVGLNAAAQAQAAARVLSITHIAIGTGAYAPTGLETALQAETVRVPVEARSYQGEDVWQVSTTITGDASYFAQEVGFFADNDGTSVLLFVYSAPTGVFAAVTEGQELELRLNVSLAALPDGTVEFSFLDATLTIQEVLDDLDGEHNVGGEFNFQLHRDYEQWQQFASEQFESMADLRRQNGHSGIVTARGYGFGGEAAYHRPSAVSFAAFGVHNHSNFFFMSGLPELVACVNGYEVRTRHTDYRWLYPAPAGGAYLEVSEAVPPPVPPSVLAQPTPEDEVLEMRQYLRAYADRDVALRDYRDFFDTYISYVEVWFEVFAGDTLQDTAHSFRHSLDSDSLKEIMENYIALNASGLKPRFENSAFMPGVIRCVDDKGVPHFAILRYRVGAMKLGSYRDYPVHEMVARVDDPATRQRKDMTQAELEVSRLGRFRVMREMGNPIIGERNGPDLLDDLMKRIPGLDGVGASLEETYQDTLENSQSQFIQRLMDWQTNTPLNSAYYSRYYSYEQAGAAGRRDYKRGFNDPYLFAATTTREEVRSLPGLGGGHRLTWAIPLELLVASPLMGWNPYGVSEIPRADVTGAGTEADPHNGASKDAYWYHTPASVFGNEANIGDPADTEQSAWMVCADGQKRRMSGSGVYIHLPATDGRSPRMRYPIAPVYHEGHPVFGQLQAVQQETRDFMAVVTNEIMNMKHNARYGGPST